MGSIIREEGRAEVRAVLLTAVRNAIKNFGMSAEQVMNVLGIADDEKEKLLKLMNES